MKVARFSRMFDPREERLPKKTGLGGKMKPIESKPLVNPKMLLSSNRRMMNFLKQFKVTNSADIRAASLKMLNQSVYTINKHIQSSMQYKGLRFEVHEDSNKHFAVIRDQKTGEVLKTIPSGSAMQIAANLRQASGILVNKEG